MDIEKTVAKEMAKLESRDFEWELKHRKSGNVLKTLIQSSEPGKDKR